MVEALTWISGASSGIGAALAATVPFETRVIDVSRSGGTAGTEHLRADLSDPAAWSAVSAHFRDEIGRFAGDRVTFVHCAGVLEPMGFAGEVGDEPYRTNVILNSAAPQVLGHGFLRALREADFVGRADLVMITSGAARHPYPGWTSYSAGKAAIDAWVDAAGQEQQIRGGPCRVVAIGPGTVATGMQETIRQTSAEDFPRVAKFRDLHETGRLREPEDAARDIWTLLDRDLENGAVVDVRELQS